MENDIIDQKLWETINDVFGLKLTSPDTSLSQENLDAWNSLGHLNLIMALEENFEVYFSAEDVMSMQNYEVLHQKLTQALSQKDA